MSEMRVFEHEEFGKVRTVEKEGEPWFVAADVCKAVSIDRSQTRRLDDDEKGVCSIQTPGGEQEVSIVNEPGLYSLILGSRKPEAKAFRRWVTHEVIPAIRKHGAYMTPPTIEELIMNPDSIIQLATILKEEREKRAALEETVSVQQQQITEMKPKVSYYDIVLQCKDLVPISVIAKDYGWSANHMNKHLQEIGVQYRQGKIWLIYQQYAEQGYTSTKTHTFTAAGGETHSQVHTYWTQKGRLFIYDMLKASGVLPLIEREEDEIPA